MDCWMIEELVIRYLENDLDIVKKRELEHHLLSCIECKVKFSEVKKAYDPTLAINMPTNLRHSIMQRIDLLDEKNFSSSSINVVSSEINNDTFNKESRKQSDRRFSVIPAFVGALEILAVILVLVSVSFFITKSNVRKYVLNTHQSTTQSVSEKTYSITVILRDGNSLNSIKDVPPSPSQIVYPSDISSVISILKSAGADNISLNGLTLHENTEIAAYGPFVQIGDNKLKSPFTIKSRGINYNLIEKIIDDNTFGELKSRGVIVEVESQEEKD